MDRASFRASDASGSGLKDTGIGRASVWLIRLAKWYFLPVFIIIGTGPLFYFFVKNLSRSNCAAASSSWPLAPGPDIFRLTAIRPDRIQAVAEVT